MLSHIPPFELGETLKGTADDGTTLINDHWLGQVFEFPAKDAIGSKPADQLGRRCGRTVKAMAVRNVSGTTLYGKRLCLLDAATAGLGASQSTGGYFTTKGYTTETGQAHVAVIDEFIATSGVADDDIFWAILEGPVTVKMQTTAAGSNVAAGGALIAGTGAATSGNSTAGGVGTTSAPLVTQLIGYALSARTTADTGADCLMMACIRFV